MKVKLFSVYDSKVQCYGRVLQARSEVDIIRGIKREVNFGKESDIADHPEDLTLFEIGEFDDMTGKIIMPNVPKSIVWLETLRDNSQAEKVMEVFPGAVKSDENDK